jgi:hypothetical protein
MPARAGHLPTHFERSALAKLRVHAQLTARELEPTGRQTLQKMLAKGWLERGNAPGTYRITAPGDAALRAQLPMHRSR